MMEKDDNEMIRAAIDDGIDNAINGAIAELDEETREDVDKDGIIGPLGKYLVQFRWYQSTP